MGKGDLVLDHSGRNNLPQRGQRLAGDGAKDSEVLVDEGEAQSLGGFGVLAGASHFGLQFADVAGEIFYDHAATGGGTTDSAQGDAEFTGDLADIRAGRGDRALVFSGGRQEVVVVVVSDHGTRRPKGCRLFGRRRCGCRCAVAVPAFQAQEHRADGDRVTLFDGDGGDLPASWRGDRRDGLLRLELEDCLTGADGVADLDQNADNLAAVSAFSNLGKPYVHNFDALMCGKCSPG